MFRAFYLLAVLFLASSLCVAQPTTGQSRLTFTGLAGAYDCSPALPGKPAEKVILFSDGRWFQRALFDLASLKITWTNVQIRSVKTRMATLQRPHGDFRIDGDMVVLYTLEPGVVYSGGHSGSSIYDKLVPDALRTFKWRLRIDKTSHSLVEVTPYNALREPVRCHPDGLF